MAISLASPWSDLLVYAQSKDLATLIDYAEFVNARYDKRDLLQDDGFIGLMHLFIDMMHRHVALSNDQCRLACMATSLGTMKLTHWFTLLEEAKPVDLPNVAGGSNSTFPRVKSGDGVKRTQPFRERDRPGRTNTCPQTCAC